MRYNKLVSTKKIAFISWVLISVGYLITHLFRLTSLPIFADESIYIRWAQLIIDDWQRYLFFAMNDGKSPLYIWLLTPFQFLPFDQLYSARVVSVLIGLIQVFGVGHLIKRFGGRPKTQLCGMLLTSVLPFWYFHHRMALIDGLLTVWLTGLLIGLTHLYEKSPSKNVSLFSTQIVKNVPLFWVCMTGISFGLALWTKLPAILFLPIFGLWVMYQPKLNYFQKFNLLIWGGFSAFLGLVVFASLRISPVFGQLFSRGSDFLYPWQEVLLQGKWRETLINIPTYFYYFAAYLTWPIMGLSIAGLFKGKYQRSIHLLWWTALIFVGPIAILGKVVYPRYLFPAALPLTVAACLTLEELVDRYISRQKNVAVKASIALAIAILMAQTLTYSSQFILTSMFDPNSTPFVSADLVQYLAEWSSGHGIYETQALIRAESKKHTLAVATEGFFGTLPDAILVYLHRQSVEGLYVEGIGQPVRSIPEVFAKKASSYEKTWLVVNSHRLGMNLPPESKIAEFCRVKNAPCLQIWDITSLIKSPSDASN
jgi:4-amino-4-deoxy-L-arabinose transferase-like glycosyltransferase